MIAQLSRQCGCGSTFALANLKAKDTSCPACLRKKAEAIKQSSCDWKPGIYYDITRHQNNQPLGVQVWQSIDGGWTWDFGNDVPGAAGDCYQSEEAAKSEAEARARFKKRNSP